jgi:hypothetical protein
MKINYASLTTETLAELVKRVLGISKKEAYVMVLNHPLLVKLMAVADDYFIVFDKKTFSGKGELVAKADLLRDNLFNGIKNSLFGMTQMHGSTSQQDAIDLYAFFETHGLDLYRYSYGDESSHLDKLIEDLEKAENKAKIERVHLTEAYDLMKAAQMNFELNFSEQTTANAELRAMESATSLQNIVVTALRNYLHYVEVMSSIDANWTPLYNELNEVVKAAVNSKVSSKQVLPNPPAPAN